MWVELMNRPEGKRPFRAGNACHMEATHAFQGRKERRTA
jgi:hypothetical protein